MFVTGHPDPTQSINGEYSLSECILNDRPVYLHANDRYYIYYDNATMSWLIGLAVGHPAVAYYGIEDDSELVCHIGETSTWTDMRTNTDSPLIVSCTRKEYYRIKLSLLFNTHG